VDNILISDRIINDDYYKNNCIYLIKNEDDKEIEYRCSCKEINKNAYTRKCIFEWDGRHAKHCCKFYNDSRIVFRDGKYEVRLINEDVPFKFTKEQLLQFKDIIKEHNIE